MTNQPNRTRSRALKLLLALATLCASPLVAQLTQEQVAAYLEQNPGALRSGSIPKIQRDTPSRRDTSNTIDGATDTLAYDTSRTAKHREDTTLQRYGLRLFQTATPELFGAASGSVGPDYALGSGDELVLTLWGDREARLVQSVDRDGQVSFEGIGTISLAGKTLAQGESALRARLARVYSGMGSTQHMDLTLGKLKRIRVFVVGEAQKPGAYFLSGNTSILSALYMAKGPSPLGTERKILVRRGTREFSIDLYGLLFEGRRPPEDALQDGDVVRIASHGPLVTVRGAVKRPGIYEMLPEEKPSQLVKYAGGLVAGAADQGMTVSRLYPGGRRDNLLYPSPLAPETAQTATAFSDSDQVLVFAGSDPSRTSVAAMGSVRFPGGYPWTTGMTAADLLTKAGGPDDSAFDGRLLVRRTDSLGRLGILRAPLINCASLLLTPGDTLVVFNRRKMSDSDSVLISGAVRLPGIFRFREGMTVKDLILQAGGFLPSAEFGKVRLEEGHHDSASATTTWLSLDSSLDAQAADTPLDPGQHLAVPWNPRWYVPEAVVLRGWVQRPGLYYLKTPGERLSSVLERAGGIKTGGFARAASFVRARDSVGRVQIDLAKALSKPGSNWDVPLRGGDTLTIPDQPATVRVSGYVNYPTSIMYEKGRSWKWYIARAGGTADSADADKIWVRYADGSILSRDYGLQDPDPGSEIVVPKAPPPEKMKTGEKVQIFGSLASTMLTIVTVVVLLKSN